MRAFQSEFFRSLPPDVQRAALQSAIAAQDPDSGFEREFTYQGKVYRTMPVSEVALDMQGERGVKEK